MLLWRRKAGGCIQDAQAVRAEAQGDQQRQNQHACLQLRHLRWQRKCVGRGAVLVITGAVTLMSNYVAQDADRREVSIYISFCLAYAILKVKIHCGYPSLNLSSVGRHGLAVVTNGGG